MIELFKNLVSSESDAKKYHLQSYHEMLEVALLKDYELNPNFLKSIQEEFNISEREHEIIVQMITDSNEKLNVNILDILNKMRYLSAMNNAIYDDYTVEIEFLQKVVHEEFNKYSKNLFNLLENIYLDYEVEFKKCRELFSYKNHDTISLNNKVYGFMSPTLINSLEEIENLLYSSKATTVDKNLKTILELLKLDNENINIAALIAMKNYNVEAENISQFLTSDNDDIKKLAQNVINKENEISIYEKIAYLNKVPLFAALSFKELHNIAIKSNMKKYDECESILEQGQSAKNLYIIVSGEVEIVKNFKKINELSSGDFFGEIAIVAKTKRTATVNSLTPLSVLVFSEESFNELIEEYPKISVQIMKEMTKRLLQNNS